MALIPGIIQGIRYYQAERDRLARPAGGGGGGNVSFPELDLNMFDDAEANELKRAYGNIDWEGKDVPQVKMPNVEIETYKPKFRRSAEGG